MYVVGLNVVDQTVFVANLLFVVEALVRTVCSDGVLCVVDVLLRSVSFDGVVIMVAVGSLE